jgi:hypothetical protein
MRVAIVLVILNYAAFAAFLILRPSEAPVLERKDILRSAGVFELSSADPSSYIAARPLYSWNEWHGGERVWVKAIEISNFPALLVARIASEALGGDVSLGFHRASWIRAFAFLFGATAQWLLVGSLITRALRRRTQASAA